jgi:hypothetical protein
MATHKIAMRIFELTTDTLSFANFLLNANVKPPTTHPAPRPDGAGNSPLIWLSDKMRTAYRHASDQIWTACSHSRANFSAERELARSAR